MAGRVLAAAGVLAAALCAALLAHRALLASDQRFIEARTGVPWPRGSEGVVIEDDPALLHAAWVRARLRVPAAARAGFATRHGLSPLGREAACASRWPGTPLFPAASKGPAPCPDHAYFERSGDRTGANPFQLLFDGDTGDLWIVVRYPD